MPKVIAAAGDTAIHRIVRVRGAATALARAVMVSAVVHRHMAPVPGAPLRTDRAGLRRIVPEVARHIAQAADLPTPQLEAAAVRAVARARVRVSLRGVGTATVREGVRVQVRARATDTATLRARVTVRAQAVLLVRVLATTAAQARQNPEGRQLRLRRPADRRLPMIPRRRRRGSEKSARPITASINGHRRHRLLPTRRQPRSRHRIRAKRHR